MFGGVPMENDYGGEGRDERDVMESLGLAESDTVVESSVPSFLRGWIDLDKFMPERLSESSDGELVQNAGHRGVADGHCPSCGEKQEPRRLSEAEMMRMNGQPEDFGIGFECGGGGRRRDKKRVVLNVGGQVFETSIETLSFDPGSMLAAMVTRHMPSKEDEIFFIDRDPVRFRHVLNYMRSQTIWLDDLSDLRALQQEADFFNLDSLYKFCDERIFEISRAKEEKSAADRMLKETLRIVMVELEGIKMAIGPENHKSNQNRKEPISGVRRRRLDYENLKDTVFRMDEDF